MGAKTVHLHRAPEVEFVGSMQVIQIAVAIDDVQAISIG